MRETLINMYHDMILEESCLPQLFFLNTKSEEKNKEEKLTWCRNSSIIGRTYRTTTSTVNKYFFAHYIESAHFYAPPTTT